MGPSRVNRHKLRNEENGGKKPIQIENLTSPHGNRAGDICVMNSKHNMFIVATINQTFISAFANVWGVV